MKCQKCGTENKEGAQYCKKCGSSLLVNNQPASPVESKSNDDFKVLVICLTIIIIAGIAMVTIFASGILDNNSDTPVVVESNNSSSSNSVVATPTGQWVLIGSYSGSGSGLQSFTVPSGDIRIDITAYPLKNYDTNHLIVSGDNGQSASVDWGSTSAVTSRSNSITFGSSRAVSFDIDYYETASWSVKVYRYE